MARIGGSFEQTHKRLDRVETTLGRLEDRVEARFSQVDAKMDSLRNLIFILFGALAGLVAVFEFIR